MNQFEVEGICVELRKISRRIGRVIDGEKPSTELMVAVCDLALLENDLESMEQDREESRG